MKALITGVLGQDGAYLSKCLLDAGYEVHGAARRWSVENHYRLEYLGVLDRVKKIDLDITDSMNCLEVVANGKYDRIFNLAANSFVGTSWANPSATTNVNSVGVLNLLEAVRRFSPSTRFYQASTSEMYGEVLEDKQSETTPFNPRSPYAVSKVYSHFLVKNYRESFGLFCASGILFNHESPLRGSEFVTRKITLGLSAAIKGDGPHVTLGNLDAKRDWGYAADYVDGMKLILDQTMADDFVLATGDTISVRAFCTSAALAAGVNIEWSGHGEDEIGVDAETGKVLVQVSPEFYRPAEVNILLGDSSKAREILGWEPKTVGHSLAQLMMHADLERMS